MSGRRAPWALPPLPQVQEGRLGLPADGIDRLPALGGWSRVSPGAQPQHPPRHSVLQHRLQGRSEGGGVWAASHRLAAYQALVCAWPLVPHPTAPATLDLLAARRG